MVSPEAAAHAFLDDDIDQIQIAQRASEGNLRVERVDQAVQTDLVAEEVKE